MAEDLNYFNHFLTPSLAAIFSQSSAVDTINPVESKRLQLLLELSVIDKIAEARKIVGLLAGPLAVIKSTVMNSIIDLLLRY